MSGTLKAPNYSFQEALSSEESQLLKYYVSYTVEKLRITFARYGININPVNETSWNLFNSLDLKARTGAAERIVKFGELVSEFVEHEIDLTKNESIVRYFLKKHRLTLSDEFYKVLSENDVIEIYNAQNEQLFRNFRFLELTDYDLVELECVPWYELFGRHESVTEKLINLGQAAFSTTEPLIPANIEAHPTQELKSRRKKLLNVRHKYVSPLYDDCNCVGLIVNEEVSLIVPDGKHLTFIRK